MSLDFVAGCVGGCASVIVGHPLDTVKVHLQTGHANGMSQCMKSLVVKEGLRGLYRGIASPLLGVAGINAITFGIYGITNRSLKDPTTVTSQLIAGGTAGFFQSFICGPMELVKCKMQISATSKSLFGCAGEIYRTEGLRGVTRGLGLTILREVPAFGIYFMSYDYLTRTKDDEAVSTSMMLLAGGCAGVLSWLLVYPVDVVKTRIQLDSEGRYSSALDCVKKSVAAEGYGFMVRGLSPTLIRAFPVNAALFATVTWTMRLFDNDIFRNTMRNSADIMGTYVGVIKKTEIGVA